MEQARASRGKTMTVPYEPVPDPTRGMTREESDALCRDLQAAGVEVRRVEEPTAGVFRVVYRSEGLRMDFTVTNARLFRETAAAGLHEELPAQASVLLGE
jgi:hypothetical protein